jgi:hypothetical protein
MSTPAGRLDRAALEAMSDTELSAVKDVSIEHPGVGKIQFLKPLNLRHGADFAKAVVITEKVVDVYPDAENKPPCGEGLNVPALITLHGIFPVDKTTKQVQFVI